MKVLATFAFFVCGFFVFSQSDNLLRNAGFEESKDGIFPLHWGVNGAERNRCVIDSEVCHGGRQSLRVGPVESYIACQQGFGDISGLDADYKLSGWSNMSQSAMKRWTSRRAACLSLVSGPAAKAVII